MPARVHVFKRTLCTHDLHALQRGAHTACNAHTGLQRQRPSRRPRPRPFPRPCQHPRGAQAVQRARSMAPWQAHATAAAVTQLYLDSGQRGALRRAFAAAPPGELLADVARRLAPPGERLAGGAARAALGGHVAPTGAAPVPASEAAAGAAAAQPPLPLPATSPAPTAGSAHSVAASPSPSPPAPPPSQPTPALPLFALPPAATAPPPHHANDLQRLQAQVRQLMLALLLRALDGGGGEASVGWGSGSQCQAVKGIARSLHAIDLPPDAQPEVGMCRVRCHACLEPSDSACGSRQGSHT